MHVSQVKVLAKCYAVNANLQCYFWIVTCYLYNVTSRLPKMHEQCRRAYVRFA